MQLTAEQLVALESSAITAEEFETLMREVSAAVTSSKIESVDLDTIPDAGALLETGIN